MTHCCGDSSPGFALATAKLVFLFLFLLLSFSPTAIILPNMILP
jgi:hypothetical protein